MSDLIDRQAAIDATAYSTISVTISGKRGFQNYKEEFEKACVAIRDKYIEALKDLPSAQHTGRWIGRHKRDVLSHPDSITYECSECGYSIYTVYGMPRLTNFCPNCGAEMKGVTNA